MTPSFHQGSTFVLIINQQHFLRAEPGIYYEDLYPLICFLPRCAVQPLVNPTREDLLPLWKGSKIVNDSKPSGMAPRNSDSSSETVPILQNYCETSQTSQVGVDRDSSPRRKRTFDPEKALPVFNSDQPLRPARNPPKALLSDYIGFLRCFRPVIRFIRGRKAKDPALSNRINPSNVESTVPLEIILYLNSYLAWLLGNGLLQAAIATSMVNNLTAMQDTLTHLARIRNTPLPFAYQAHLRISLW